MADQDLKAEQEEVNRLMGRCVLRLQQYELQLKSIIAHHDVSASLKHLEENRAVSSVDMSRQTLGALIKTFLGSVLVSRDPAAMDECEDEAGTASPTFRRTVRLETTEEHLSRTEQELRELVQIRNDLIHHFMERHDLWSLDGCPIAREELGATCDRIGADLVRLREWAADQQQVLHEFGEYVRSDMFHNLVVNGINPDGTVFWPGAGIVAALREAAQALAVDGWTEVSAAKRWIMDRYPYQTPQKYGCTSYPQVLHESRAFDLCRLETEGLPRRHYRLRNVALR